MWSNYAQQPLLSTTRQLPIRAVPTQGRPKDVEPGPFRLEVVRPTPRPLDHVVVYLYKTFIYFETPPAL